MVSNHRGLMMTMILTIAGHSGHSHGDQLITYWAQKSLSTK